MKSLEQEMLTNNIELKIGILKLKISKNELENNDSNEELIEIYGNAKNNGISTIEAKLLLEDLILAIG